MGRKEKTKTLHVYLNTAPIGELKKSPSGEISFKYEQEWLQVGFAISQSMPLQEEAYKGEIVSRYFENLLPDNDEIKKIVATKFGAESTKSFDLLSVIGKDCVGALSFVPKDQAVEQKLQMDYSKISDAEIAKKLRSLGSTSPLGMEQEEDFRISIAGAQEKTALLKINGKWHEPHGLTPTTHIFKSCIGALGVDINFQDSIDNEWASLFLLKLFGLNSCHAEIAQFEDQRVLVVERFDRRWRDYKGEKVLIRIPQEDFCQALGISPYKKYQSEGGPGIIDIAKFLLASKNLEDRLNFFKSIIVFDLLFATDGHAKNFSIFLEKDGFKLTPFYDVMSGYFFHKREKKPLEKLKLAMKVGNSGHYNFRKILKRHYAESAKLAGISDEQFEQLMDELKASYEALHIDDKKLDPLLDHKTLEIILEGMKKRAAILF